MASIGRLRRAYMLVGLGGGVVDLDGGRNDARAFLLIAIARSQASVNVHRNQKNLLVSLLV